MKDGSPPTLRHIILLVLGEQEMPPFRLALTSFMVARHLGLEVTLRDVKEEIKAMIKDGLIDP